MLLSKVTAVIRPRTPYEAIDLGVAMALDAGRGLWLPWFMGTLPVFLLLNLAAYHMDAVWLALPATWVLKPMFDRIPLFVLSRRLFGDTPSLWQTLKALPLLWLQSLPGALIMDRLDLARSLDLPVTQLEGLRWFKRAKRLRLLQRTSRGAGVTLTLVCFGIELAFFSGAWALVLMFVPFEYLPETWRALWADFFTHASPWHQFATNSVWYLAVSVVEPLYVGAGFALYLNRRTELEAWDIEIAFKRMAEHLQGVAKDAAAVLLALILAVGLLLHPAPASAAQPVPHAASGEPPAPIARFPRPIGLPDGAEKDFQQVATKAYGDPDLSPHERVGHWEPISTSSATPTEPQAPAWWLAIRKFFGWLGLGAGKGLSFLPWLIGLALVVLAVMYRRWLLGWFKPLERAPAAAPFDPGLKVMLVEEPLPADIPTAARDCWERGDARRALALLYRGGVLRMQELTGNELPHGATEAECLREAARLPAASAETLRRVVRTWQYAAYAHRLPETEAFSQLLDAWRADLGARV